jgi:hypothetical protein
MSKAAKGQMSQTSFLLILLSVLNRASIMSSFLRRATRFALLKAAFDHERRNGVTVRALIETRVNDAEASVASERNRARNVAGVSFSVSAGHSGSLILARSRSTAIAAFITPRRS